MAEEAVLSLRLPRGHEFEALYSYLTVDEPAVHLMPLHFLPSAANGAVESEDLLSLGIAAKLDYARNRWLDEVVDERCAGSLRAVHRLDRGLTDLISARFKEVLHDRSIACQFFEVLAGLYARHGASLAIDGSPSWHAVASFSVEDYSAHARCRHGTFRASVDAVLLLVGASSDTLRRARESWHLWALGVQFWDDALDVEEDFESNNVTWTVFRTLEDLGVDAREGRWPDRSVFYEAALVGGAVSQTLTRAESCFRSAADLADAEFPSWAGLQRACIAQTSTLRADFRELSARVARG